MGNASILKHPWPYDAMAPLQPPRDMRVLWRVFPLRDPFGAKYTRQGVLYCAKVGLLQLWRDPQSTSLNAWLIDPSGYPTLLSLGDVQIARMDRGGGMLLFGTNLATYSHGVETVRQSWWCTVASVTPADAPADPPADTMPA